MLSHQCAVAEVVTVVVDGVLVVGVVVDVVVVVPGFEVVSVVLVVVVVVVVVVPQDTKTIDAAIRQVNATQIAVFFIYSSFFNVSLLGN